MVVEEVSLSADKNIPDLERFFLRAGKYIDSGYKLKEVSTTDGIRCTLYLESPKPKMPIGIVNTDNSNPIGSD